VQIDGHDLNTTCGQSKAHRGSMSHVRRDEILTRYGLPPGEHPGRSHLHIGDLGLDQRPEPRPNVTPRGLPYSGRYLVTASADCPDANGYCDFALGAFGIDTPIKEGVRKIIVDDWADQRCAGDRIDIPQDAVRQISELLTPGSSLIISDYGISSETGPDTDFIVTHWDRGSDTGDEPLFRDR
jgi:hypothetical protein